MASDLSGLIQESLGPLPRVCQEQVLLDLERARMTAEDYRQGNAVDKGTQTWRQMMIWTGREMNEMDRTIGNIANVVQSHDNAEVDDVDCFEQIRLEVQAHGYLSDDTSDEEESEEDDAMDADQDEEQGVFCETCDGYYRQGVVAWFTEPFTHNGRTLYSACAVCRWRLNLEDRPVLHW